MTKKDDFEINRSGVSNLMRSQSVEGVEVMQCDIMLIWATF